MSLTTRDGAPTQAALDDYRSGRTASIAGLLPSDAIAMSIDETLDLLRARVGTAAVDEALELAVVPAHALAGDVAARLSSPVASLSDPSWLRRANVVGINMRTVGSAWSVVPYSLTLPAVQSAIHLLPFLEPGVASSLYGPASWEVDPTIADPRLTAAFPALADPRAQLRAVIHLLHLTGRTVGMDVLPHTDRFSEHALGQPDLFEWMERKGDRIVRHGPAVTADVEARIVDWLATEGTADGSVAPSSPDGLYRGTEEARRLELLFGRPDDAATRLRRRVELVKVLHALGYETVPATMAPPYRGIEVDPSPTATIVDELGMEWRDFRITRPTAMSRVFGPLARYDLFEAAAGEPWAIDTDRPRQATWEYITAHYAALQADLGLDFMRGDMAHVQVRPHGVARRAETTYDILGAVAQRIRRESRPSFAYLAESFLAGPGYMAYGDEPDHLEMSRADVALGDLQSLALHDRAFLPRLRWYLDLLSTRSFAPCFTVITADKDDPRFDAVFWTGNELRLFLALFLADMPSYMGLGYEQRDVHRSPAPNEAYTKLYVFHLRTGPKATSGPYVFGRNMELFHALERIRAVADANRELLAAGRVSWLRPPDATASSPILTWRIDGDETLLCLANLDPDRRFGPFALPAGTPPAGTGWSPVFSTAGDAAPVVPTWNGAQWVVEELGPSEGRIYRIEPPTPRGPTGPATDAASSTR